jgi:hypothetical protein
MMPLGRHLQYQSRELSAFQLDGSKLFWWRKTREPVSILILLDLGEHEH